MKPRISSELVIKTALEDAYYKGLNNWPEFEFKDHLSRQADFLIFTLRKQFIKELDIFLIAGTIEEFFKQVDK